ncbi:ribosome maturation factor RimM [uncultured Clostridium sp.]|uniref:ribosome maturation factor RimM n=1 Tax=uncultured Clostridium sp. TaxID=59620 RepID=UPI002637E785|nr:ribosome maturation factor RimM [uncultured Clostridium sp.]
MEEFLRVGQIINTHGVMGEVKVMPLTDDMKRFKELKEVYLDGKKVKIENVKFLKDKVVLKLDCITSMNEAEKYKFKRPYLEVKRSEAVELPEDTFFVTDLIGCTVKDTEDFVYGEIAEVIKTGSNDVYWVKGNKEILVPVLKEFVNVIDVKSKTVIIRPSGEWNHES